MPKVRTPGDVEMTDKLLRQIELAVGLEPGRIGIEAQIEDAAGLIAAEAIAAASPRLEALVFGPGDYSAAVGIPVTTIGGAPEGYPGDHLNYVYSRILVAARAAGIQAIDGPYGRIGDDDGLRERARMARALGYDGKWTIHPEQIATVNEIFSPSREEFERASAVLEALERSPVGALRFEGELLDEASRKMAERVVRAGRAAGGSRREADRDHVAVAHRVVAALDPQHAALARAGVAAGVEQLLPADDLGAHEAALDVGVDLAGGVPGRQPAAQMPGLRRLVLAGGEERDQVEQREGAARSTRSRPASPTPSSPRIAARLLRRRARRARTQGAPRPRRRRRPATAACAATSGGTSSVPSSTLATNSTGLAVSGASERSASGASAGGGTVRAGRPGAERLDQPLEPGLLGDRRAIAAAGGARHALEAPLRLLEVGEHQLGLDRLDVAERVDAALGVDDVRVAVRAHDVDDRVGLADVGEEAVAEPLAAVRAGDEAGDVVEVDRVVDDLAGVRAARRSRRGARRATGDDGDVRLDRRERVVGGLDAGARERVEERGLARRWAARRCRSSSRGRRSRARRSRCPAARRRARRRGSARRGRRARRRAPRRARRAARPGAPAAE